MQKGGKVLSRKLQRMIFVGLSAPSGISNDFRCRDQQHPARLHYSPDLSNELVVFTNVLKRLKAYHDINAVVFERDGPAISLPEFKTGMPIPLRCMGDTFLRNIHANDMRCPLRQEPGTKSFSRRNVQNFLSSHNRTCGEIAMEM